MVEKGKEASKEPNKDIRIKDATKFTYQCKESGDDQLMELEKVNLITAWKKEAKNEMELPFRVLYSEDRYVPEGGAPKKFEGEKEDKGTIEIGFRGTALELGGDLVDKAKGMEQGLFDAFYLKMPLGGGTMPFGPRRLFRYSDELRESSLQTACKAATCGFEEYCLAGCVGALDLCTTFLCWPCNNVNDTHGFDDWHQVRVRVRVRVTLT